MHNHYEYILPSAEKRAENARKLHAMHGAPIRQIAEVEAPTLPHHDHNAEYDRGETNDSRKDHHRAYGRGIVIALGHLQEAIAPRAQLTKRRGSETWQNYLRLTEYDEHDNPVWAIADHEENGNGLFIWRRDRTDCDPDTAFSTTRRNALDHGCISLRHPANMDRLSQEAIQDFYLERVLDELTA